jgi:hypothetical protein
MSPSSRKVGSQPTLQSGVMLWCDLCLRAHALAPYCCSTLVVARLYLVRCLSALQHECKSPSFRRIGHEAPSRRLRTRGGSHRPSDAVIVDDFVRVYRRAWTGGFGVPARASGDIAGSTRHCRPLHERGPHYLARHSVRSEEPTPNPAMQPTAGRYIRKLRVKR